MPNPLGVEIALSEDEREVVCPSCPTGALSATGLASKSLALSFDPSACPACGACASACPEGAVSLRRLSVPVGKRSPRSSARTGAYRAEGRSQAASSREPSRISLPPRTSRSLAVYETKTTVPAACSPWVTLAADHRAHGPKASGPSVPFGTLS
jgi:ferredoxin